MAPDTPKTAAEKAAAEKAAAEKAAAEKAAAEKAAAEKAAAEKAAPEKDEVEKMKIADTVAGAVAPSQDLAKQFTADLKEALATPAAKEGPLAAAAAVFGVFMKYFGQVGSVMDSLIPGRVGKSLDEEELAKEKLSDEEAQKLLDHARTHGEEWKEDDESVDASKYKGLTSEQASTQYVSSMLGIEKIDDGKLLFARLSHAKKGEDALYAKYSSTESTRLMAMERLPKGTAVLFQKPMGSFYSGFATGNGHEIAFFNADTAKVEKFDLKGLKCSFGAVIMHVALVPNFPSDKKWAEEHPDTITAALSGPQKVLEASLEKNKKDYETQKTDIVLGSGETKKVEAAVEYVLKQGFLKDDPLAKFKLAAKELTDMPESPEKAAALAKFKETAKGYKEYIVAEKAFIEGLIAKENVIVGEHDAHKLEVELAKDLPMTTSDPASQMSIDPGQGPQMSLDPQREINAKATIKAYELLAGGKDDAGNKKKGHFDLILEGIEKYLS